MKKTVKPASKPKATKAAPAPVPRQCAKFTHGVISEDANPAPALERKVSANLADDGNYYVVLTTLWAKGEKPTRTQIGLTPHAYELMLSAMWELHVNRDRWACVPVTKP